MSDAASHRLMLHARALVVVLLCCSLLSGSAFSQANRNIEALERAAALINTNRLAEAEQQLNQILKVDPSEANALNLLGTIRARQENLDAAERLFLRAVRSNPALAGAHFNLAHIYFLRRQPDKTAAELREVLRLEPSNTEAVYQLASIMVSQRQYDECIAFVEKTRQNQDVPAPLLAVLGDAYLKKRDVEKAEQTYHQVLQLSGANLTALLGLAQISYAKAELQPAAEYMSRAADGLGNSPDSHYQFALVAMGLNLRAEAIAALKKAIGINPAEPSYSFALGLAWLKTPANLNEAEQSFRTFLKLRPDDLNGQLHLGYVLLKQKRLAESRDWIEKTVRSRAASPEAFYYLGLIAQAQDEEQKAIELFLKAVQQAPSFGSAYVALGATYLRLKDFDRAQKALETGVKLNPDDSKGHYNLAVLYARLNQGERAQAEMKIVQRLNAEKLKREGKAPDNDDDAIAPPISP